MRQYSIRKHVAWLTLAPLLIMATSLGSFFLHDRFSDLDRELIERGQLIARQIASSSEYGVFSNNRFYLQNIAQGALQQTDVRGVAILNAASESLYEEGEFSGALEKMAGNASSTISEHAGETRLARTFRVDGLVDLHTPIRSSNENLWLYQPIFPAQVGLEESAGNTEVKPDAMQMGAVILKMSRVRTEQIKSRTLWLMAGATLLFLAIPFCLIYFTSRSITSPIRRLSKAVQEIGYGKLETRVSVSSHVSELSAMEHGINEMAAQLQHETEMLHHRVEEATRIAAIAFESHEGMMITDASGVIIRVNDAFTKLAGYTSEEVIGKTPKLLTSGKHNADFYAALWDSVTRTGAWQGEIWNRRKDGEIHPVWASITAVEKEDGEVAYYVATYTDITVRKAAENELYSLVNHDALTQLPNRRMFADRFDKAMAASNRNGRYGALLFLDLDNFKPLNDLHGHAAGDLLLAEVARRLVGCVREVDTVARFGGDEFVVMLSELDADKDESMAQATIIAEKIRAALAEPYFVTVQQDRYESYAVEHHCTTSIGVTLFFGHEASAEEIIKSADKAMYRAKEDGRNTIRF